MGPPQEEEQDEQDEKDRAGAHVNGNTAATIPREVKTTTRTQTHNKHNQMHWPKDTAMLPTMVVRGGVGGKRKGNSGTAGYFPVIHSFTPEFLATDFSMGRNS